MKRSRITRLRRRLSYANVIATLALFFALTGGAMAGVKYITTTDTIPATSDLAGSSYGNPLIAKGKVDAGKIAEKAITSSKFDSTAVAPDSTRLAGHALSDFPLVIARGTRTVTFNIGPGQCDVVRESAPGADPNTDTGIVSTSQPFIVASAVIDETDSFLIQFCNLSTSFTLGAGNYRYLVLR